MPWDYSTNKPTTDYTKTFSNQYDQAQCHGCSGLQTLFTQLRKHQDGEAGSVQIHENYRELAQCAERCIACQTFQRGLLLQQITVQESLDLEKDDSPVNVTSIRVGDDISLQVKLGDGDVQPSKVATINCTAKDQSTHLQGVANGANWDQLRTWMRSCDSKHSCRSQRWSNKNPSWLIKILPGDRIQLINGRDQDHLIEYVALSYCWGNPDSINAKDPRGWERVLRAHTDSQKNGMPVPERLCPFPRSRFPETLRDAIKICERVGLEYLWVDQVCIISEWDKEASNMHEIYGNAYVTLFCCSADKAIDQLCTYRNAWHHPVKACRLFGHWLSIRDPSLAELRLRNPLSRRGWILQEERLSPRILFWTAQRAYWSCCGGTAIEAKQSSVPASPTAQSRPQDFMLLTRSGDSDHAQEEWLELVASYTRRSLSEQGKEKDRFRAVSGLAVRYLSSGNQDAPQKNEYLAGLWRDNFARHLAWRVTQAVKPEDNLRRVAPTWSWASLPLRTDIELRAAFEASEHFALLTPSSVESDDSASDIVNRGASIRSVRVSGRFRRLIGAESIIVPWAAVMPDAAFEMPLDPSLSIHARSSDGKILVYEAHKAEIVCQLDYLEREAVEDEKGLISVDMNAEAELFCLEVGQASMLLLEEVVKGGDRFCRVGVGLGYRKNFFDGHEVREMTLE